MQQLRRQYLGARGLHFRLKPMPVPGSTAGVVVTVVDGSTEPVVVAAGG